MACYFYQCVKIINIEPDRERERGGGWWTRPQMHREHILCNQNHMNDDVQSISKTFPIVCHRMCSTSTKLEIEIERKLLLLIQFRGKKWMEREREECECRQYRWFMLSFLVPPLRVGTTWKWFKSRGKYFYWDWEFNGHTVTFTHSEEEQTNRVQTKREHSKNFNCKTIKRKHALFSAFHSVI